MRRVIAFLIAGIVLACLAPAGAEALRPTHERYYAYPEETRYFYFQLTDREKQAFSLLYDGVMGFELSIMLPEGITEYEFGRVMVALYEDCPELMQLDWYYEYYTIGDIVDEFLPKYLCTPWEYEFYWRDAMRAIGEIAASENFGETELEKQLAAYEYVIEHCYYDDDEPYTLNAEAVYTRGRAQCTGYVAALNLALRCFGIQCAEIAGQTYTGGVADEYAHEWSLVNIDGEWYHCDATNDDWGDEVDQFPEEGSALLLYFNVTDEFMQRDCEIIPQSEDAGGRSLVYPTCDSTAAHYARDGGLYIEAGKLPAESIRKVATRFKTGKRMR